MRVGHLRRLSPCLTQSIPSQAIRKRQAGRALWDAPRLGETAVSGRDGLPLACGTLQPDARQPQQEHGEDAVRQSRRRTPDGETEMHFHEWAVAATGPVPPSEGPASTDPARSCQNTMTTMTAAIWPVETRDSRRSDVESFISFTTFLIRLFTSPLAWNSTSVEAATAVRPKACDL